MPGFTNLPAHMIEFVFRCALMVFLFNSQKLISLMKENPL
jgi:hypothetical protein